MAKGDLVRNGRITKRVRVAGFPQVTKTFDAKTEKREAERWYQATKLELQERKKAAAGEVVTGHTVLELLTRYRTEVSPRKKGERWESVRLLRFERELPIHRKLELFVDVDGARWRDEQLLKKSGASVRRDMNLLSSVWQWAVDELKWCHTNPWKQVKKPPDSKSRRRTISLREQELMLNALDHVEGHVSRNKKQLTAMAMLLALETGMRASEVIGLRVQDIKGSTARLHDTKNGTSRDVPLIARARELVSWLLPEPDGRLFLIRSTVLDATFRKARASAGLSGFVFHDTRHTAATRFGRSGMSFPEFCDMFGWKDPKMAMVYFNPTADDIAARLDQLSF